MKQAVNIPVATVGLLDSPDLAEYILQTKQADLILKGRVLLCNINWLYNTGPAVAQPSLSAFQ